MSLLISPCQESRCMGQMKTNQDRVYHNPILDNIVDSQQYRHDFVHFLDKDYKGNIYGFSKRILGTQCLDMDEKEAAISGDNDKTMDLVVGVARFDDTNRTYTQMRLLPVELKLGCSSFNGISKSQLLGKNQHTRDMLAHFQMDNHSVFIFKKEVVSQARSGKSRWEKEPNSNVIANWEMLSPEDYNEYIGFENDFPYRPITNLKEIRENIKNLVEQRDWDGCIDYIERERKIAEQYKIKYKLHECQAIAVELDNQIDVIMRKKISTDYTEYFSMLKEEMTCLTLL